MQRRDKSSADACVGSVVAWILSRSVHIDTFGTNSVPEETIEKAVLKTFSFKPADIIGQLDLLRPIYSKSTNYGHFGKEDADLTWEKIDKATALKKAAF